MEITKIKRVSDRNSSLKLYGEVLSDSGEVYRFAYFRRPTFRGWICNCDSFTMDKFAKKRNCKHLHFVRAQVGRYGTALLPNESWARTLR